VDPWTVPEKEWSRVLFEFEGPIIVITLQMGRCVYHEATEIFASFDLVEVLDGGSAFVAKKNQISHDFQQHQAQAIKENNSNSVNLNVR
jgi:hypothetical protein